MVTTVSLQPPFEYYWWVIVIAILLMAGAVALCIYVLSKVISAKKAMQKKAVIKTPPPRMLMDIKNHYMLQLQGLMNLYSSKQITKREAYQRLSLLIRGFVHESTGLNVENFTKSEIKAFGIKQLDQLMEEYYIPEFAEEEKSQNRDFNGSYQATLGVIKAWS